MCSGDIVASSNWHDSLVYLMSDGDVPKRLRGTVFIYQVNGLLTPSVTGAYEFSLSNTGKAKLYIDDELLIDNTNWTQISGNIMNCGSVECFVTKVLDTGKSYRLRVDNVVVPPPAKQHDNTLFHKISGVREGMIFKHDEEAMFHQAVSAAEDADVAVLVVGHNNDTEREVPTGPRYPCPETPRSLYLPYAPLTAMWSSSVNPRVPSACRRQTRSVTHDLPSTI
jgi:beta-glucosidase